MRWRIAGILVFALVASRAESQPPTPSPRAHSQTQNDQASPKGQISDSPTPSSALPPSSPTPIVVSAAQLTQDNASNNEKHSPLDVVTNVVNCLSTLAMAVFSWLLFRLTREQKDLTRIAVAATESIERAYVTISHTPQSLTLVPHNLPADEVWFEIQITNCGNTPAEVIGGVVSVEIGDDGTDAPATTPTKGYQPISPGFLVPDMHVTMRHYIGGLGVQKIKRAIETITDSGGLPLELWLVGFVYYKDRFDGEHCGHYARHWDRNNRDLVFDQTTAHLNYDRPITQDQKALILKAQRKG